MKPTRKMLDEIMDMVGKDVTLATQGKLTHGRLVEIGEDYVKIIGTGDIGTAHYFIALSEVKAIQYVTRDAEQQARFDKFSADQMGEDGPVGRLLSMVRDAGSEESK